MTTVHPQNLSDEQLARYVRDHDQEGYGELVSRYKHRLLRYAAYLVRDHDVAADVVQSAFIKAFMNLQGFNTSKSFSSWIYRIVHNEAMNAVRRRKKHVSIEDQEYLDVVLPSVPDVAEDSITKEERAVVRERINNLPIRYREPVALYFLEEKSYNEISDILRIPVSTVGTHIRRGKAMIKQSYEKK